MGTRTRERSVVKDGVEARGMKRWAVLAAASLLIFTSYLMQYQVTA